MNEADYEVAFQIIANAGNAKSSAMLAISEAKSGNFDEAERLLGEAENSLHNAHQSQTALLTAEARGNQVPLNIILVHAQDHLSGAILTRDLASEIVDIHKQLHSELVED